MRLSDLIEKGLSANQISVLTGITARQVRKMRMGRVPMLHATYSEEDAEFVAKVNKFETENMEKLMVESARKDVYDSYRDYRNSLKESRKLGEEYSELVDSFTDDLTPVLAAELKVASLDIHTEKLRVKYSNALRHAKTVGVVFEPPEEFNKARIKHRERVRSRKAAKSLVENPKNLESLVG